MVIRFIVLKVQRKGKGGEVSKMDKPKKLRSPNRESRLTKTPFHFNGQEMKWGLI